MSGRSDFKNYLLGQLSNVGATPANTQAAAAAIAQTHRITVLKPGAATSGDDAAAATDIAETPIFVNMSGTTLTVTKITYCCGNTGFTAADATASTLTLFSRTSAGATQTSIGTMSTATTGGGGVGTLAVGQQGAFTLNATLANRVVPVGGCITLTRTHASTGTVIPGGTITIEYTED
jgi:hypothetical protein